MWAPVKVDFTDFEKTGVSGKKTINLPWAESRGHISPDVPLEALEAVLHALRSSDGGWGDGGMGGL